MSISRREMERRWSIFKASVNNCSLIVEANGVRLDLLRSGVEFGKTIGVSVPVKSDWWIYVDESRKAVMRFQRLIKFVDKEELALRFTTNDIDIMAPPGTTDDEIAQYQKFGFIIAATIGYIVIVSAVYTTTTYLFTKNEKLAEQVNNQIYLNEVNFGKHKDPEVRQRWQQLKTDKNFQPKKSVIKSLTDGITDLGDFLKEKTGMGLTIAVPIIALLLLWKFKR